MAVDATQPNLATALARLQTELPEIHKDQTAKVETKQGAGYSYTYSNLTSISAKLLPMLGKHGLSFIAKPTWAGDRFVLAYSLLHESGEREDGEYPLNPSGTPQQVGSAITYGRRYCLCAITGVAPDDADDDGKAASAAPTWAPPPREQTRQQQDSNLINPAQLKALGTLMGKAGITDRQDRLDYAATVIRRDVASSKELTKPEASQVIDALKQLIANEEEPAVDGDGVIVGELGAEVTSQQPADTSPPADPPPDGYDDEAWRSGKTGGEST